MRRATQELGFEPAKRALSRIAKEGRKYGVSLCVVTQRPSDLAPGLLSECNTMFALRMTNHDDQDILRDALSEASHGLMNFLPALRNGEAIAVGEGVSMPMRICFSPLPDDAARRARRPPSPAPGRAIVDGIAGRCANRRALAPRRYATPHKAKPKRGVRRPDKSRAAGVSARDVLRRRRSAPHIRGGPATTPAAP